MSFDRSNKLSINSQYKTSAATVRIKAGTIINELIIDGDETSTPVIGLIGNTLFEPGVVFNFKNNRLDYIKAAIEGENTDKLAFFLDYKIENVAWQQMIYFACKTGKLKSLQFLLENYQNIAEVDFICRHKGGHMLCLAAASGNRDLVKYLLDQWKIDVDARSDEDATLVKQMIDVFGDKRNYVTTNTALACAAKENHLSIVELLISRSADVNSLNVCNSKPLCRACYRGNIDVVMTLVQAGATIGFSEVTAVIEHGHLDVLKYFVARGADIKKLSFDYDPRLVIQSGNVEMLVYLQREHGLDIFHQRTFFDNPHREINDALERTQSEAMREYLAPRMQQQHSEMPFTAYQP